MCICSPPPIDYFGRANQNEKQPHTPWLTATNDSTHVRTQKHTQNTRTHTSGQVQMMMSFCVSPCVSHRNCRCVCVCACRRFVFGDDELLVARDSNRKTISYSIYTYTHTQLFTRHCGRRALLAIDTMSGGAPIA